MDEVQLYQISDVLIRSLSPLTSVELSMRWRKILFCSVAHGVKRLVFHIRLERCFLSSESVLYEGGEYSLKNKGCTLKCTRKDFGCEGVLKA